MSEENVQNVNVTNMVPLHVRVTSIDIEFSNVVSLTFKAFFASIFVSLVILGVPALIFAVLTR
jgi:hypothetical protein